MGKRSHAVEPEVPKKKRLIEKNNENVDTTNVVAVQSGSSVALSQQQGNDPSRLKSGKIKAIHLRNFMCHSNFRVDLNDNVNVFVGLNGSGKSAILTAIAIGLGSKASSTARSTSIKDLVKRGEGTATIEITLSNDGYDSFERDVYGNQIIVTRNINANSGSSIYKIKTANGRVVSTKKETLDRLTMYFNIQVENPVLLLNQDSARSFLKDSEPKKLYKFFLKATQIEAIIEKLNECAKQAATSKTRNDNLVRSIEHLEEEIKQVTEKLERLQSVARMRRDITNFKNEIEWLKVIKVEKVLSELQSELKKKREEIEKIEDMVKNRNKYDRKLKDQIRDHGTKFTQLEAIRVEMEQTTEASRRELESVRDSLSTEENQKQIIIKNVNLCNNEVQQLQNDIQEHEANPTNVENLKRENMAKIESLEKKKSDLMTLIENAKRDLNQFSDTASESREIAEELQKVIKKNSEQSKNINIQIQNLKASSKDALAVYGRSMSDLVHRVEELFKQKRFTEMPRGPLGRYIQVTEQSYKGAVENILDGFIQAFYVSCDKDRVLLLNTMKQFRDLKVPIITGQFQKKLYDIEKGKVQINQNEGRVLIDIIKVSDPVVMNCLIDQKNVETIVIVDKSDKAMNLTEDIQNVPKNLSKVFLLDPYTEFYPAPSYRNYALNVKPSRYLQTNCKEVIASMEMQKAQIDQKTAAIDARMKQELAKERAIKGNVKEKTQLLNELKQKDNQYSREILDLRNVDYPKEDASEFLKCELATLMKKKEKTAAKLKESEEKIVQIKALIGHKEQSYESAKNEAQKVKTEMHVLQNEIDICGQKLNEMTSDIQRKTTLLVVIKRDEEELSKQENEAKDKIRGMVSKISGQRVVSKRNEDQVQILIRRAEHRIENIESNHENIDDIQQLLNNKTQQLQKMSSMRNAMETVLKTLETCRNSRYIYIKRLRSHMSLRVKHKFDLLMHIRNFTAEIIIDYTEQTLELKVIPRDSQFVDAVSNTKQLSGGERSFSTVAFLIALWSCVDHPFYFLDEYDVFADELNRHEMTKLLFHEAGKKLNRQYGFLTPQDFSNIEPSETITIHKLQDPERMA